MTKKKIYLTKILITILVVTIIIPNSTMFVHAENKIEPDELSMELYENSYRALTNRITDRGYAPTSTTGAYPGMFVRDSSIQIMAQNIYGDTELSRKMLDFLLSYHVAADSQYASHVLKDFQDEPYGNIYTGKDDESNQDTKYYDEQTDYSIPLYLINGPKHAGGTGFIPSESVISSISVHLNKSSNDDKVIAKIYKDINDESSIIATTNYTFGDNASGWQTISFDQPINVTPGEKYYLTLQATDNSKSVVWNGSTDRQPNSQNGWNYDLDVLNGWKEQDVFPAFKIHSEYTEIEKGFFTYQGDASNGLYLINADVHKAAQEFIPQSNSINGIKAYLTKSTNQDKVIAQICTDLNDESTILAQTTYTFGDNPNGWQTIMFDKEITVRPGQKYYLVLQATKESGNVVWYGTNTYETGFMNSWNYDSVAIGGWLALPQYTAFGIISNIDLKYPIEIAQPFKVKGNEIESISTEVDISEISGQLVLDIRENYNDVSSSIATSVVDIDKSGKQNINFNFKKPIKVKEGKTYYAVLTSKNTKGEVYWTYKQDSKADSYLYNSKWSKIGYDFSLSVYPEVSGNYKMNLITLSDNKSAWQEIPVDNEIITGVKVILGKTKDTQGQVKATLYKGYGENAQTIDSNIIDVKELDTNGKWITFKFGLPLEKTKSGNYYLKIETIGVEDDSIVWYGTNQIDHHQTILQQNNNKDTIIKGDASYEALRSKIGYIDNNMQTDTNYMLIHAWVQYVNCNKGTKEDKDFIKQSYPIIAQFANYYLDNGYFNEKLNLLRNPALEHSREGRMWNAYDLLTNVFASQALYELSDIASKLNDKSSSYKWLNASKQITNGINNNFITKVDGVDIYAELYDIDDGMKFVKGISWINWAPMAAEWYAMDKEIMKNTYNIYKKYASIKMYGYDALSTEVDLNQKDPIVYTNMIGKGFAWELMFNNFYGNEERIKEMLDIECATSKKVGNTVYPESWWGENTLSDPGNQEHCGWQHYAMSYTFPQLTKTYSIEQLTKLLKETDNIDQSLYTKDSIDNLVKNVNNAKKIIDNENATKDEIDGVATSLQDAINTLKYKEADYSKVDVAITKANNLNKDEYKDFSAVDMAVKAVKRGLDITHQQEVDAMAKAIENAINELVKKDLENSKNPPNPTDPMVSEAPESIDTGDYSNIGIFASLLTLSIGAIAIILNKKKKNYRVIVKINSK